MHVCVHYSTGRTYIKLYITLQAIWTSDELDIANNLNLWWIIYYSTSNLNMWWIRYYSTSNLNLWCIIYYTTSNLNLWWIRYYSTSNLNLWRSQCLYILGKTKSLIMLRGTHKLSHQPNRPATFVFLSHQLQTNKILTYSALSIRGISRKSLTKVSSENFNMQLSFLHERPATGYKVLCSRLHTGNL